MISVLIAAAVLQSSVGIGSGEILIGDLDKDPKPIPFTVAMDESRLIYESAGRWKIVHTKAGVTIYDLKRSRCIEYVLTDSKSKKIGPMYAIAKRIFPIMPVDYAMAPREEDAQEIIKRLKADPKAKFTQDRPGVEGGGEPPAGQGGIRMTYLDPVSSYKNEVTWVVNEDERIYPKTMAFILKQPNGHAWAVAYTTLIEGGEYKETPSPKKNLIRIKFTDIEGKGTKNGALAKKWLAEISDIPAFTVAGV